MINSSVHARLADVGAPYVFNAASAWEHIAAQCGGSVFPLQSLHLFLSNPFPALGVPFTSLEDLDGSPTFLELASTLSSRDISGNTCREAIQP